jgi:hypothetical protein
MIIYGDTSSPELLCSIFYLRESTQRALRFLHIVKYMRGKWRRWRTLSGEYFFITRKGKDLNCKKEAELLAFVTLDDLFHSRHHRAINFHHAVRCLLELTYCIAGEDTHGAWTYVCDVRNVASGGFNWN